MNKMHRWETNGWRVFWLFMICLCYSLIPLHLIGVLERTFSPIVSLVAMTWGFCYGIQCVDRFRKAYNATS